jgi:hypothetical protein
MFTTETEIETIGNGLLARTLPKPEWTHAAHFAAALWLLRRRSEMPASDHMPGIIRAYNEATGVANTATSGYHETITRASLAAAANHASAHPAAPLHILVNTLLAGPCGNKDWLLAYWSRALLFTPRARAIWVPPDLADFPFPV